MTVKPYYADTVTLHHGDALEVLRSLPDASVDAVVTDPPYGLEFMGKDWDGADGFRRSLNPADAGRESVFGRASRTSPEYRAGALFQQWCEQWAAECLRVLKPGGYLLAFGGTRTVHRLTVGIEDAGFEIRDGIDWLYGSGFPKSLNLGDGRGTALKPAREPIVMARKSFAGTVAANVATHGTGALNIDACRVGTSGGTTRSHQAEFQHEARAGEVHATRGYRTGHSVLPVDAGRWPSNVVLSHAPDCDPDEYECVTGCPVAEMGEPSRFFPVFRYEAKATSAERPRVNGTAHPTVKPLDLMRWLVRLVTPAGGVVLEPFAGSGTTAEACVLEGLRCIAIEREAAYLPLIVARLSKPLQPALDFGAVA